MGSDGCGAVCHVRELEGGASAASGESVHWRASVMLEGPRARNWRGIGCAFRNTCRNCIFQKDDTNEFSIEVEEEANSTL